MRIKKFVCSQCGAPKVKPYKGSYVVCDFCGTMMDVDYYAGLEVYWHSAEHKKEFEDMRQVSQANSAKYLAEKNRDAYLKEQFNYWDFYFTHFPEYLPPTVPKGEKYKQYVQAMVDMVDEGIFDTIAERPEYLIIQEQLIIKAFGNIEASKEKTAYYDYDLFLKMVEAYMNYIGQKYRRMYDDPKYSIMTEVLPYEFQLKSTLSGMAQTWIPALKEEYIDDFLGKYKLIHEYVEVDEPLQYEVICVDCKKDLLVPKGALVCICEHCRHQNILLKTLHCPNCGIENNLPESWKTMIDCNSCGTELRVVNPSYISAPNKKLR